MGSLVLNGNTSGSVTLAVPDVAGSNTATIGAATGTHYPFTAGTAVASTSGTSIDFTSIPSWVKRVTVMFKGVSLSSNANFLVQLGSGSVTTTGYVSCGGLMGSTNTALTVTSTSGMIVYSSSATRTLTGSMTINLQDTNTWVSSHSFGDSFSTGAAMAGGGYVALGGTLDRVRITTTSTDTFDAGSINILYE